METIDCNMFVSNLTMLCKIVYHLRGGLNKEMQFISLPNQQKLDLDSQSVYCLLAWHSSA